MPNQECLVLGDGKLGLLVAQVLRQAGAHVLVVGHHSENLEILAQRDIRTVLESDWNPSLYSLVVDATGSVEGLRKALAATRPRGTVVLKSTTGPSGAQATPANSRFSSTRNEFDARRRGRW
jgi:threonine dehydrogenase-like Zn-dependent dehydrogenase